MRGSDYIQRNHVFTLASATDRAAAIKIVVGRLVESGAVPAQSVKTVVKGILDREALGSTGIGRGIAIPHTKTKVVAEPLVAFAKLGEAVDYGATDGEPVHSLFFVISPFKAADQHVQLLRWISSIARSDYYARLLKNTEDADSLYDLFAEIDERG